MQNTFAIKKLEQALLEVMHRLPKQIGAEAVRYSKASWQRQGWLGDTLKPWQQRKNDRGSRGRAILIKSGRLRRSIRVLRATPDSIIIGTDVPYAAAHNNGFRGRVTVKEHTRNKYSKKRVGTGKYTKNGNERKRTVTSVSGSRTVSSHSRTMRIPKRQFLGDSPYLRRDIQRLIAAEIMKAAKRI